MKLFFLLFAAKRYWSDAEELQRVFSEFRESRSDIASRFVLSLDGADTDDLAIAEDELPVLVPLSGAVQPHILRVATQCSAARPQMPRSALLYAAYVKGNLSTWASDLLLLKNAAPTTMDVWGVLHHSDPRISLILSDEALRKEGDLFAAYLKFRQNRLILVGETEPWVVSASRTMSDYESLGLEIISVSQEEVRDLYINSTDEDGAPYAAQFINGAEAIKEPTNRDILNAGVMTHALLSIINKYDTDGMAIACFNLLGVGTTACLGVSYINDHTDKIAACEGDLDSAVSMLIMKLFTKTKVWMANPALHPDGTVNFSHCTAPICVTGEKAQRYTLRNHHESGIGASLEVSMPVQHPVTAFRISGVHKKATIHSGISIEGDREPCCHTQMHVRFQNPESYIQTALGCHQVFCFEDIAEPLRAFCKLLHIQIEE